MNPNNSSSDPTPRGPRTSRRKLPPRRRLFVERLEDRCMMSVDVTPVEVALPQATPPLHELCAEVAALHPAVETSRPAVETSQGACHPPHQPPTTKIMLDAASQWQAVAMSAHITSFPVVLPSVPFKQGSTTAAADSVAPGDRVNPTSPMASPIGHGIPILGESPGGVPTPPTPIPVTNPGSEQGFVDIRRVPQPLSVMLRLGVSPALTPVVGNDRLANFRESIPTLLSASKRQLEGNLGKASIVELETPPTVIGHSDLDTPATFWGRGASTATAEYDVHDISGLSLQHDLDEAEDQGPDTVGQSPKSSDTD